MRALFILWLSSCAAAQQYVISTLAGGAPPPTPLAAIRASIGDPARLVADAAGNIYFGSLHSIFKVDPAGNLTRIAGTGRAGNSGDLGPAISAQLMTPMGIAIDGGGNLYIADHDANVARRISAGVITTIASGLNHPSDIAVDSRGSIFIADTGNNRVVRVGADGSLADAPGTAGLLNGPGGVAVDSKDTLYIADTFNGVIRQLTSDGRLSTIAGTGSTGVFAGDGGPADKASISLPTEVAADRQGNLYIADFGNARIRMISQGVMSTVAGSSTGAPLVEGEPALSTRLAGPTGVVVDGAGTMYFVEGSIGSGTGLARGDYRVWRVGSDGQLHGHAGTGVPSFSGDNGPAIAAQFDSPTAIALDSQGNLLVADSANHRVRSIDPGGTINTLLGTGSPGFSVDYGSPAGALFHTPRGVAADTANNIYVADTLNNRVRRYQAGGNLTTYAGNGNGSYFGDGGAATSASVNQPAGLALDGSGNLYIADTLDNAVRKVTPSGTITTVAGNGLAGFKGDGGPATRAQLNHPYAVAVDAAGNVYIADTDNNRVRRVDPSGNISTIAGNGATDFLPGDSAGTASSLNGPKGVAVDSAKNVYIADTGNNRVRKLFPSGAITTIAGYDGQCCYSGDGALAVSARLNRPAGLMVSSSGAIYIADAGNDAIRVLRPVTTGVSVSAVTNAASNLAGPIAPGEVVTIYGSGLDGTTAITIGGISARVLYSTTNQAGATVPYAISGASAPVSVQSAAGSSAPVNVSIAATAPGVFTADSSGRGQALALNQDGTRNGTGRPTTFGETLTLFVTGEGQTNPAGVDGRVNPSPAPVPVAPVSVTIGGAAAEVVSASGIPGALPGVIQVTVRVPDRVFGAVPVVVSVARVASQDGVTLVVR